jgi:prolyl 4-hydroxylase
VTNTSPFLKIAPLKLEEFSLSPYIVVYHDVIYEKEIEVLKTLSKQKFVRAWMLDEATGKPEMNEYRISKFAWFMLGDHKYVKDINFRTQDMTGLNMKSAESLQVLNYGVGGHYEAHFDFFREESAEFIESLGIGNRIATVLFYMSDVEQGGATVFPDLGLSLWPKKGSAVFWWNLFKSGVGDDRTRHAACPVLVGSKWGEFYYMKFDG